MLDKTEFQNIRADLKKFEAERELLMQGARDIIQLSKRIIYALQRDDTKKIEKDVQKITQKVKKLSESKYETGIRSTAIQEYVEALAFYYFLKDARIPARKQLGVETNEYLLGLCDLTGELVRKAVNHIIKENYQEAVKIKDLVEGIYGEFLHFELRNSELRKKSDAIKYNLKKLEELIYDLKIKGLL